MNAKTRRFLKRMNSRKRLGIINCMKDFYKEDLNKNIIFSFYKKRNKGRDRKNNIVKKNKKRIEERIVDLIGKPFIIEK